ncbi:unknown [Clostridium sp. CAG:914]|nr:unknown [Clostridium sp. CAG:914]
MKKNTKLNDLRFNITEDMNNMFIEVVMLRQMLIENKLSNKDRKLLEKELTELTTLFVMEFKKNNVEERKLYNELINK